MSLFDQIAIVVITLLALVGSTLITLTAAGRESGHAPISEAWEGTVLVRTRRAETRSPVYTWLSLFLVMMMVGLAIWFTITHV